MKIIHQPWWQRLGVQPERSQPYDEEDQGEPKLQVFKIYVFMGLTAEIDFCFSLFYSWLLMTIIETDACFLFRVIFWASNCFWNCNINLCTISIIEIVSQMSGMTFVNKKYATVILEARIKTENSNLQHLQQKCLNHIYYDKWYKKFWPNTVSASSM